jgi:hypothetical protein
LRARFAALNAAALWTQEFRQHPVPFWLVSFSNSYEHFRHVDHSKGDSRPCPTNWKRQSSADCLPGALQRIRALLSNLGKTEIPPPAQKTFAEGEILEHALTKSFRIRNDGHQKSVFLGTPIP